MDCRLLAVLVEVLLATSTLAPAMAHDFYSDWRQPGGRRSCCSDSDCRPTRAYRASDGLWRAWNGKEWLVVPARRVLTIDSPDGRSHLCEVSGKVLCFVHGEDEI